ncbi:MAG: TonB family protein [Bdellovibrionota bacterium]
MQLKAHEQIHYPRNDITIKKGVIVSVVAHLTILAGFFIQGFYFRNTEPLDLSSAVRVDIAALPDKYTAEDLNSKPSPVKEEVKPIAKPEPEVKQEVKPAPEPEVKKPVKPEPDTVNLSKNNKKKQLDAFQKLKAQSALDKIKDSVAKEKKPGKQIKGNVISPGSELTGLDKLTHQTYGNELNRHIKQHWAIPEWLRNKPYSAQINVKIDAKGNIVSKDLVRGSGNKSFDENAMATIEEAAPFPPPPEKLADMVRYDGILIGFPE